MSTLAIQSSHRPASGINATSLWGLLLVFDFSSLTVCDVLLYAGRQLAPKSLYSIYRRTGSIHTQSTMPCISKGKENGNEDGHQSLKTLIAHPC